MISQLENMDLSVYPLSEEVLRATEYDAGYYAIGYEARSSYIVSQLRSKTKRLTAIDLFSPGLLSYDENKQSAKNAKDALVDKRQLVVGRNPFLDAAGKPHKDIFVDISSMDRRTLSVVLLHLLTLPKDTPCTLSVLYAPAKFNRPPTDYVPVASSGPVNPLLGGRPRDPKLPTIMILGLGYEVGLSLGVVEYFEPAHVLAFSPRGIDKRYDEAVDRVNAPLFADQQYITKMPYNLFSPANLMIDIKARLLAIESKWKVVFVPLGPKMFSAVSIICGYLYAPNICVWRVSTVLDEANAQRHADGSIFAFRLQLSPRKPLGQPTS